MTRDLTPEEWANVLRTCLWGLGGITLLSLIGALILAKFRGAKEQSGRKASETLTKFREMHSQGELSDQEFRTIKAKLAEELRQEIKDSKEPG